MISAYSKPPIFGARNIAKTISLPRSTAAIYGGGSEDDPAKQLTGRLTDGFSIDFLSKMEPLHRQQQDNNGERQRKP